MAKRTKNTGIIVFVAMFLSLILGIDNGLTADLSSIIKKARAKYAKFEKEVKDMTIVQQTKTDASGREMNSEIKMQRKGKKFRMEFKMDMPQTTGIPKGMSGMENIVIFDGKDSWMISSIMGKKKLTDKEGTKYETEKYWWELISKKTEIAGTEKVGGRVCYILKAKEASESPFTRMWLDKKNLTLVKGESKGSEGETMILLHSDFKKIKGDWEIPYKTETYMNGKLMSTSLVKSIGINRGLSDDLFDPNKIKAKGSSMMEMMKKMMQQRGKE